MKAWCVWTAIGSLSLVASIGIVAAGEKSVAPPEAAVTRARKMVHMLDDVYKSAIVLITDKYVNDVNDFPAGSAAVQWFKHISEKGTHEIRLLDATGRPSVATNVARDDFERHGIQTLKSGKDYVESIEKKEGKFYLRALTPVPVVMKKCIMCHPHYANAKTGEPIGALSYTIVID
jgi:hypothetical protein